jgi:hypothetical protein
MKAFGHQETEVSKAARATMKLLARGSTSLLSGVIEPHDFERQLAPFDHLEGQPLILRVK